MKLNIILSLLVSGLLLATACKKQHVEEETDTTEANVLVDGNYDLQPELTTIQWTGSKVIGSHTGTIQLSEGSFSVDGNAISGGSFNLDATTIVNTDLEDAEDAEKLAVHLKSVDFFDAENYPYVSFEIISVKSAEDAEVAAEDAEVAAEDAEVAAEDAEVAAEDAEVSAEESAEDAEVSAEESAEDAEVSAEESAEDAEVAAEDAEVVEEIVNTEYIVTGTLTIKGISNEITFPATITSQNDTVNLTAAITFDRTLFDMKFHSGLEEWGDNAINDEITLQVSALAIRNPDTQEIVDEGEIVEETEEFDEGEIIEETEEFENE